MTPRVVITGMGAVSPLGLDVSETWEKLAAGTSGVGPITLFDASDLAVQIACEVKGFEPLDYLDPKEVRRRERFEHLAAAAAQQALGHAGLVVHDYPVGRVAVIVSSSVGGLGTLQEAVRTIDERGARRLSPFLIPMFMPNGAAGLIAIDVGAKGPCYSIASACASGADGIGLAWMLIRAGVVDAAIAGGTEATVNKLGVAAFDRVNALSRRNEAFDSTPAPFDMNRDGFVIGEGAAILILESLESAQKRQVEVLAELVGYASTADAFHITAPSESGEGGAAAISLALASAGLEPGDVDYVNAHGTGTQLNDVAETRAIKAALGEAAYRVPISSTKSMTGHIMGATAALEAIFAIQSIRTGIIPPTLHLNTPDPECDLDYVPNTARAESVEVALSNAFGFGGHNAVLAFRRFSG